MKKILVPFDFSKPAANAFRMALDIAQQSNATIHVLHVIELPVVHDSVITPVLNFEETLFKDLTENAESRFQKILEKYPANGVKYVLKVQFGAVARVVLKYIQDETMDLVLMGSHGASGVRELFLGSNAEKLVRHATVPVLITKEYTKGPIKNIVFPNSLEIDDQEELVARIKSLQSFFKAHLHLVWINTPVNFTSDSVTSDRMNAFVKRFGIKDFTISVFNDKDEERGIVKFANLVKGDLIAMGTHGRTGIAHLINGSLAEDIVNHYKGLVWTYSLRGDTVDAG